MRAPPALGLASVLLAACSGLAGPSRTFLPLGDYQTSTPRSRAEGGHTPAVIPPPGVGWEVRVLAFPSGGTGPASRFEFQLDLVDRQTPPGTWRITPVFERAELVDDEGHRFPCTRVRVPELPAEAAVDGDAVPARHYDLLFEVPGSYRFGRMNTLAVHWSFVLDGQTWAITTRLRAA
jgi:hypothetical protein